MGVFKLFCGEAVYLKDPGEGTGFDESRSCHLMSFHDPDDFF